MTVVLFILKALVFFIIELMLSKFTAEQMKIKFPLGALAPFALIFTALFLIPYAGWILATIFLLRFTAVMTNARTWPESTAFAMIVLPLSWLLKVVVF